MDRLPPVEVRGVFLRKKKITCSSNEQLIELEGFNPIGSENDSSKLGNLTQSFSSMLE